MSVRAMLCGLVVCSSFAGAAAPLVIRAGDSTLSIERSPMRIAIAQAGRATAAAHAQSSLLLGTPESLEDASVVADSIEGGAYVLQVRTPSGRTARVDISFTPAQADFVVIPSEPQAVMMRFAPASPGYGLGDHSVAGRKGEFTTDITGYRNDRFLSGQVLARMISNFAIYPRQRFAFLVWDPGIKMVRSTADEVAQGVARVEKQARFTVFSGSPREIYRHFLDSRNAYGYPVFRPKYEYFGLGWEAWGALAWDTNQKSVTENVDRYLAEGYPLAWMVVGSGFWPRQEQRFHATTSFGMYDKQLYPDARKLIAHFHAKGLKFFQGLRTTFIVDGPFSAEGVQKRYFVEENGKAKVFNFSWPRTPTYILDWKKPEAVRWFCDLAEKWAGYGVDGFKEDVFGYRKYTLGDDKLDPVNDALMRRGYYIMGRNAYLTSAADVHRVDDFNYNQNQDRGPVNALALAYSGFPLVYPDLVVGTFAENHFDTTVTPKMRAYAMRNAQWGSVHPVMGMGQGPWSFGDKQVEQVMKGAAMLHDRLWPYFYSQAIRWQYDGYPWSMAPLPVAFPEDADVHGRENSAVRGYQWMIGDSLLATPVYGDDYETATARDVYLPAGVWIDYDTGRQYQGPRLLKNFALPHGKTPLFVGGTGIVIEKKGTALVARVYPVTNRAETLFFHRNAERPVTIRLQVSDWKNARVTAYGGSPQTAAWQQHALEFELKPGESYEVR